jgi:signal transduction histidine kinase
VKWATERHATIAFALTFALLLINTGLLYRATVELVDNDRRLDRSHEVLVSLGNTLATLNEAQAGERGYLLTGETSFLEPYDQAVARMEQTLARLKALTSEDPEYERRVALLESQVNTELDTLGRMIQLRKETGFEAARQKVVSGRGQRMAAVRQSATEIMRAENELLSGQAERATASTRTALLTLGLSSLMDLVFVGGCYFVVRRNLRHRRKVEEALTEAGRRKDEFLAMLGHELRNPLAPMLHAAQLLRAKGTDGPAGGRALEVLQSQVQHVTRLVDDLLDVSRIDRGKIRLRRELCDISELFSRAVEIARPLVESRRHELTVTLPRDPVRVDADPVRLVQVLANLLTNAAKYTPGGGGIWLTAECVGAEVVIRVRDNGVGIPAAMLPRVFDPFRQLDQTVGRAQGGLGIGLTLARSLVELHGGRVAAFSEGPGQGSTFVVRLPAEAVPDRVADGGRAAEAGRPAPRRILVVDDNAAAGDMLAAVLEMMGHEVRVARDGLSALATAETYRPDVVLLDIGMPGMDGYELARRLRGRPGWKSVRLVAVTGYGQEEDRRRSQEAGCDYHFVKPVEPEAIQELLAQLAPE